MKLEDEYADVLQNIEAAIIMVYRNNPKLSDRDVQKALDVLIRAYELERRGRTPPDLRLPAPVQQVRDTARAMCEWRLGRQPPGEIEDGQELPMPDPLPLNTLIRCLKRIRKSVRFWTRERGRQGYLTYIEQFIP